MVMKEKEYREAQDYVLGLAPDELKEELQRVYNVVEFNRQKPDGERKPFVVTPKLWHWLRSIGVNIPLYTGVTEN